MPRSHLKASESDACKEAVASLKHSYNSDDNIKGSAPKGKKKKRGPLKKTEIWLLAILPHGLSADGYLNHTREASPLQIDKLIELGFAKIEALPIMFDQIETVPGALKDEFPWRLLKLSRSHLELYHERPDGYDAMSAKGKKPRGKEKQYKNSLLLTLSEDDMYSDDEPLEYNTQSKNHKDTVASTMDDTGTTKPSLGNPGSAAHPPITVNPWSTVLGTVVPVPAVLAQATPDPAV
ncbi:hypothetical protein K439DRAFT_1546016 [Ramaria rubella]|nr:hypothetical protein K439DRAFT_1546016 [Ramaria rubella]